MKKISFQVDTRLAKLLSENYRSSEKALKELVDNAWDADSEVIDIVLPDALSGGSIVVSDDGSGMTEEELLREYLFIASDRRMRRGNRTAKKNRLVKGKKGIGKFAGLMSAQSMKLETWARGKKCQFSLSTDALESAEDIEKLPLILTVSDCDSGKHGTRITLSDLRQNLAFPNADKMRQLLLQEYGREEGFLISVNGKELGVDDVQGNYSSESITLPKAGAVELQFTVSDQKGKLKQPGISIRVGGKIVGKPSFFGLDSADDFPAKLLDKVYGEVNADGLSDHVTADWGALVDNSELYAEVENYVQTEVREKVKEVYGREISLAQARLQKRIKERLSALPDYKREYADKAIKSILGKYYGENESKVEPVVNVLLNAMERSDYRSILDYIYAADHEDIHKLSEALSEFGLAELAILGQQARGRLEFLDRLEQLCRSDKTNEATVHTALEKNLWVFGPEYSLFSSNKTLRRQVEDQLRKKYTGTRHDKRPDLMLNVNYAGRYLLIGFKRPQHSLRYADYQQATGYRNDFRPYIDSDIEVLLVGGKRGNDLPPLDTRETSTTIMIFDQILARSRSQLNWLLNELGAEEHA